ncbi:putative prophage repressor protein [Burkholderia sp. YI23]|nr:putative prophage repressor protein [Burkholderia sp. YI23]
MNAIDIGDRIAKLRKDKGLSQSELARALDIKPQAVQKWESGGSGPKASRLVEIAGILSVGIRDLVKGTVYEYIAEASTREPDMAVQRNDGSLVIAESKTYEQKKMPEKLWGKVPLITWEQAGMWAKLMTEFSDSQALDWIEIPNAVEDAFCLKVEDESAVAPAGQKSYAPGDIVAVNPHKEPKNRSTVVVVLKPGTRPVLRQILTDGDRVLFKTINPEWPDKFAEKTDEVEIIGTVTGKWVPEE